MQQSEHIRIRLKAFDHRVLDNSSTLEIVEYSQAHGRRGTGPDPAANEDREIYTVLARTARGQEKSREQFEIRTHKRLCWTSWTRHLRPWTR